MNNQHDKQEILNKNISLVIKEKRKKTKSPHSLINLLFIILFIVSLICLCVLLFIRNLQSKDKVWYSNNNNEIMTKISDVTMLVEEIENKMKHLSDTKINLHSEEDYLVNQKAMLETMIADKQYENLSLKNTRDYRDIPKISNIFESKSEVIQLLDYIKKQLNKNNFSPRITQLYKATRDGDNGPKFIRKISNKENIFLIIKTPTQDIFGVFYNLPISSEYSLKPIDNNAFIFSLNLNKIFPINHNEEAYWFNEQMFFNIGKRDIFISDEFLSNSYSLNHFPMSFGHFTSEDEKDKLKGVLTSGKIGFGIVELEVYQLNYK